MFDFLMLSGRVAELELEAALAARLRDTLLELDCVVECWISQGPGCGRLVVRPSPRRSRVTLVDEDRETLRGRMTSRDGNRVWVQVEIPGLLPQSA